MNLDSARICLIDDHDMVRAALASELVRAGYEVVAQSNGQDFGVGGLKQFLEESTCNLVIMDLSLGPVSGLELIERIQSIGRSRASAKQALCRIIVLTMSTHPWQVLRAFELGAMGYVLKGSSMVELLDAVRWVSLGRRFHGVGVDELINDTSSQAIKLLSAREHEILKLTVQGLSSVDIGKRLHLSPKTVDTYRSRLLIKLNIKNQADLFVFAVKNGYLQT